MSECGKCGNKAIMSYHYFCYKCGNSLNENGIDLSDIEKELETIKGLMYDALKRSDSFHDKEMAYDTLKTLTKANMLRASKLLSRIRDNKES